MLKTSMLAITALLSTGCTVEEPTGPIPNWDYTSDSIFDAPWPSDMVMTSLGTIDLSKFPNPHELALLDSYISEAEALHGFGPNSPVYFTFETPIDQILLPTPEESLIDCSSVMLIDIDPTSSHWGEKLPVQVHFQESATTYQPENLLTVAPVFGTPMASNTTYAVIITTALAKQSDELLGLFAEDHTDHEYVSDLEATLFKAGLNLDDVAVATVFTTDNPLREMALIDSYIRDSIDVPDLSQELKLLDTYGTYDTYEGSYAGPVFQHGERPYATEGGGLQFDVFGRPEIHSFDDMRLSVTLPTGMEAPADGWPVLVYAHGTGGSYRTFCNSYDELEVATQLGLSGFVGIGFDQPLHGTRATSDTDPEWHTFNYLNPTAARSNFRQGAIDIIYLVHALASYNVTFKADGVDVPLDKSRILFMGHSQGGITGAIAQPFISGETVGSVISGAGGAIAITVVERKDPLDIAEYLEIMLGFSDDEVVTELHPITGLIQTLIEVSDPINYSPYWFQNQGYWYSQSPAPVLVTSGIEDTLTPYRTALALASAAGAPQVEPVATDSEPHSLLNLPAEPGPLSGNITAYDGSFVTGALSQWPEGDHWVVFGDEDAAALYMSFLESASSGAATIDP